MCLTVGVGASGVGASGVGASGVGAFGIGAVCILAGCSALPEAASRWDVDQAAGQIDDAPPAKRPSLQQSNHRIASAQSGLSVDLRLTHLPAPELGERFWERADETQLPAQLRRRWLDNGLRIGVWLGDGEVTGTRRELPPPQQFLAGAGVLGSVSTTPLTMIVPPGEHRLWPISPSRTDPATVLIQTTAGLTGHTLVGPQLVLDLSTGPVRPDGGRDIQIRPHLSHGEARPTFVAGTSALRVDTARPTIPLSSLDARWPANRGGSLVIAAAFRSQPAESDPGESTPQAYGLGEQLLHDRGHIDQDQYLVVQMRLTR